MDTTKAVETVVMRTTNSEGMKLLRYEDDVILTPSLLGDDANKKLKDIYDLEYKKGDIMICSYPKCGLHWVSRMILILMGTKLDFDKPAILALEFVSLQDISSVMSPRLLGTHMWPKRLPQDFVRNDVKVILLLRNPKDVLVSYYHHLRDAIGISNNQTWNEFFSSFLEGVLICGSYFDYLKAWSTEMTDRGRQINLEVFLYEDFIEDSFQQLKRMMNFLGLDKSDSYLETIIDTCSFNNLKDMSRKGAYCNRLAIGRDGNSVIYRRGAVGDWKNHFTVSQNEQFEAFLETRPVVGTFGFKYI